MCEGLAGVSWTEPGPDRGRRHVAQRISVIKMFASGCCATLHGAFGNGGVGHCPCDGPASRLVLLYVSYTATAPTQCNGSPNPECLHCLDSSKPLKNSKKISEWR
jgi:hypothetical protein